MTEAPTKINRKLSGASESSYKKKPTKLPLQFASRIHYHLDSCLEANERMFSVGDLERGVSTDRLDLIHVFDVVASHFNFGLKLICRAIACNKKCFNKLV